MKAIIIDEETLDLLFEQFLKGIEDRFDKDNGLESDFRAINYDTHILISKIKKLR